MKPQDFTVTIPSPMSPSETIERIGLVSAWWTGGFEGAARKVDDTFTVRFGKTFVDFENDWELKFIVQRAIEIISEASRRIPDELKATRPEIEWRSIASIGNFLGLN